MKNIRFTEREMRQIGFVLAAQSVNEARQAFEIAKDFVAAKGSQSYKIKINIANILENLATRILNEVGM
jgi:hypothetical protein